MSRLLGNIALLNIGFLLVLQKSFFPYAIHKFYHGSYTGLLTFIYSATCPTLRVARAEIRLTVYRSSYINSQSNTRALVSGVALPPALSSDNWQKLYCRSINHHCYELKKSEQIEESIEMIRFYWVWALGNSKTTVLTTHQLYFFFLQFFDEISDYLFRNSWHQFLL